jgi:hypothetical protein
MTRKNKGKWCLNCTQYQLAQSTMLVTNSVKKYLWSTIDGRAMVKTDINLKMLVVKLTSM